MALVYPTVKKIKIKTLKFKKLKNWIKLKFNVISRKSYIHVLPSSESGEYF